MWIVTSIAIFFTFLRLGIRVWAFRRILMDDYAVVIALSMLIAVTVLYRYIIAIMFEINSIAIGEEPFSPDFLPRAAFYLKMQFAIIVLFWTSIWIVKASFLTFYQNLLGRLHDQMLGWWIVCGITFCAYLGCWATQLASCIPISHYFILGNSSQTITLTGFDCEWNRCM